VCVCVCGAAGRRLWHGATSQRDEAASAERDRRDL